MSAVVIGPALVRRPRSVLLGVAALGGVVIAGTVGYVALGFGFLDALYQTVTTITTVASAKWSRWTVPARSSRWC